MDQSSGFPNLFTSRLALRKLKTEDDQALLTLRSDDIVNRYLNRPKATTLLQVREFINKINIAVDKNDSFYWAITLPDTDRPIGTICLWNISEDRTEGEIGYELDPVFHGRGLMQEAISKVIDFGFHNVGFKLIIAYPDRDNANSRLSF